ncbi:MAG: hypothetical protein IJQ44_07440 [Bacteroidaceae bacterium]|nr:hypothetical protein [Bacteroidaceae bacterium]
MNKSNFLPEYTLAQLSERVCRRLLHLQGHSSDTMWDGITELCMKIESEPRAVDSVIAEAKKKNGSLGSGYYYYHHILVRVYILLYYRHAKDSIFQTIVFPELVWNMGAYGGDNVLKNIIKPTIDKIIEQDELLEKARAEEKKEVKPVFAYVAHSRPEMDRLYDEYSDELLFRKMAGLIRGLSEKYDTNLDEANVWFNAKQVVHALRDLRYPELFIKRAATSLVHGQIYDGYRGSQIILICVYAMVRSAKDNTHFTKFISAMENLAFARYSDMDVLGEITPIKNYLDKEQPFDDYDYIGDSPNQTEVFTRADFDRALADYKAKIQELKKENKDLEETNKRLQLELTNRPNEEAKNEDAENKAWVVELFSHFCYEDEKVAQNIIDEMSGKTDPEIADIIFERMQQNKISPKTNNIDMWRVLHAAKILESNSYQNFDTALRRRRKKQQ